MMKKTTMIDRRFIHEYLANDLSKVANKTIAILGCGAIGSNLAVSLARRGFRNFWLLDFDRIEPHNISTQVWFESHIGQQKAIVLANILYSISKAKAMVTTKDITELGFSRATPADVALIADCLDNSKARAITMTYPVPVLHIGLSAEETGSIVWNENYTLPPDVPLADPCAYPLSRSIIELTVAIAGSIIVDFILTGVKRGSPIIHAP